MSASSSGMLDLPEAEFTYIGRPWTTFMGRWAAIRAALEEENSTNWSPSGRSDISMMDLGSNNGFFSLQTAHLFPEATVIGVEGAVGVGNGSLGTATQDWEALCGTTAICTHLRWIRKLGQKNCGIAPEVWDYQRIKDLGNAGVRFDVTLQLSVVHHIDNYSADKLGIPEGPERVPHTIAMLSDLLKLAPMHIVELPDRPWISHVHDAFNNDPRAILEAAGRGAGGEWEMRKIYENAWIGHRELWLLRQKQPAPAVSSEVAPSGDKLAAWRRFFPTMIPSEDPGFLKWVGHHGSTIDKSPRKDSPTQDYTRAKPIMISEADKLKLEGTMECMQDVILGVWQNGSGERISLGRGPGPVGSNDPSQPPCWARYDTRGEHPISWRTSEGKLRGSGTSAWTLSNHGGDFALSVATASILVWSRGGENPFTTSWARVQGETR